jgi:hypothetical protein
LSIVEDNLTLIAYVNKDIESELHARFDIKGIYREWFNLSDCDLNDMRVDWRTEYGYGLSIA